MISKNLERAWERSLREQIHSLETASQSLNKNEVNRVVRLIRNTNGTVFFAGIGKNSFVAQKLAATYTSLGIKSQFLDPVNSLHGDFGFLSEKDLFVCLSKSGETEELQKFVDAIRKFDFKRTVAVTSSRDSTLAKFCSYSLIVNVQVEGDNFKNKAPLASTLACTAILQAIAVEVSLTKGFDERSFIRAHPGGALGRR